ncbi:unnamed protein product [Ectocarpus sp. 6 AP-2014]
MWMTSSATASSAGAQVGTTLSITIATFARLARSQEFYRSTRPSTALSKQEVVEIGDWVPWEFQCEDEEVLSKSEELQEIVPYPPRGGKDGGLKGEQKPPNAEPERPEVGKNKNIGDGHGEEKTSGEKPRQMYRKIRLRTSVSSPFGASHNDALQGHTLSESEDEVTYTETDCISRLPMFRGNLVVKTIFRVTRSEHDPQNSIRVKVTVVVRDVKLIRGVGWLMSKAVQTSVRDGGKKQAANTLNAMVLEAKPEPELDGSGSQA